MIEKEATMECLLRIKAFNPKLYKAVLRLRRKHHIIMEMAPGHAYDVQCRAVERMSREGLINLEKLDKVRMEADIRWRAEKRSYSKNKLEKEKQKEIPTT